MTGAVEPPTPGESSPRALSGVVVPLLKGVVYRESDAVLWNALVDVQARVRDYVAVLGLELVLDEAEGHAFLRSRPDEDGGSEAGDADARDGPAPPRLIARRPLSFPVSLMLALLRKKLAELDAGGGDTRLVLTRDEIVEMIRVFLPDTSNEARLIDRIDAHLNRVVELGFLRRMRTGPTAPARTGARMTFEVRRILKAFVDAQWLAEFDARLAEYRARLEGESDGAGADEGNGAGTRASGRRRRVAVSPGSGAENDAGTGNDGGRDDV